MRRVLVCGGRNFSDVALLWRHLDELARDTSEPRIRMVIDGASDDVTGPYVGADYWAHQWALARNIPTVRMHAKWGQLGKAAGPIRNRRMLYEGLPDIVIAFPGNRGTRNMVQQAIDGGVKVIRVGWRE